MKDTPSLPPLAFVCPKIGEPMRQDGPQKRFCDHCQLHVHDLSSMSKTDGARFLDQAAGPMCISFTTRADGSMVSHTRWSGWERRWNDLRRGVFTLLSLIAPLSLASCASRNSYNTTGGKVCVADADPKAVLLDPKDASALNVNGGPLYPMSLERHDVRRKHPLAWSAAPTTASSENLFPRAE